MNYENEQLDNSLFDNSLFEARDDTINETTDVKVLNQSVEVPINL